jgi:hypothetical protein
MASKKGLFLAIFVENISLLMLKNRKCYRPLLNRKVLRKENNDGMEKPMTNKNL